MQTLPISLLDLVPKESQFELSSFPGERFTLRPWSLRVRAWAIEKYDGNEGLRQIFEIKDIGKVAGLAYFMLKDRSKFPTEDDFLDSVRSTKDQLNIYHALLETIGIGEPEIKKIEKSLDQKGEKPNPNPQSPSRKKTGAKSSTP